ncbi:hypothetical protein MKMG_01833 [Methanogenium sp. MK-MG]|nr:hypothetical protein MKMG_01833 [Methanogenium sp. MK-MG]
MPRGTATGEGKGTVAQPEKPGPACNRDRAQLHIVVILAGDPVLADHIRVREDRKTKVFDIPFRYLIRAFMRIRLSMPCLTRRPFHQQIDRQVTDDIAFKGDDVACFLDHFTNIAPLQTVLLHDGRKCRNVIFCNLH